MPEKYSSEEYLGSLQKPQDNLKPDQDWDLFDGLDLDQVVPRMVKALEARIIAVMKEANNVSFLHLFVERLKEKLRWQIAKLAQILNDKRSQELGGDSNQGIDMEGNLTIKMARKIPNKATSYQWIKSAIKNP